MSKKNPEKRVVARGEVVGIRREMSEGEKEIHNF